MRAAATAAKPLVRDEEAPFQIRPPESRNSGRYLTSGRRPSSKRICLLQVHVMTDTTRPARLIQSPALIVAGSSVLITDKGSGWQRLP